MEKLQMKTGRIKNTRVQEAAQRLGENWALYGTADRFLAKRVKHLAEKLDQKRGREHGLLKSLTTKVEAK